MELQHFVYSLYPRRGYSVTAKSPLVDEGEWKAFCQPVPVEYDEIKKWGRVWSLRIARDDVVLSLFTAGARDEYNRPGLFSHNIIIHSKYYLAMGATPVAFAAYFIQDVERSGEMPALTLKSAVAKPDFTMMQQLHPDTLKRVLWSATKGESLTVFCPDRNPDQLLELVSAVSLLLPPSARILSFTTAALGVDFKQKKGDSIRLKLIPSNRTASWRGDDTIDIDQPGEFPGADSALGKTVNYMVDCYLRRGVDGLAPMHKTWESKRAANRDLEAAAKAFLTSYEVSQGLASVASVEDMLKRGQPEGKAYAQAMLDEGQWQSKQELARLLVSLLDEKSPKSIHEKLLPALDAAKIELTDKLEVCELVINSVPRTADLLVARLKTRYETATLVRSLIDLKRYPSIASRLLRGENYESFESASLSILVRSTSDAALFARNANFVLAVTREQFAGRSVDLIMHLIESLPANKDVIIAQVRGEDLMPPLPPRSLKPETQKLLQSHGEKILKILRIFASR